jgi:hypothetical protein
MKNKGISRDVGKTRSREQEGGPGLGHLPRMAIGSYSYASQGGRGRRKKTKADDASRHRGKQSLLILWSMIFGLVAIVVIALGAIFWLKPYLAKKPPAGELQRRSLTVIEGRADSVPKETRAVSIVKRALAVTQPEEVEKFIESDGTSPEEVLGFLGKVTQEEGQISSYDWLPRLDTTREDISGVLVTFKKGKESRNRLALLVPDEEGNWKMDFAAFARATTPDWSELMSGRVNSAAVRVYVARDQYFNGPYSEQEGWRCYGIGSPDVSEVMYGYCLAGSAQDLVLSRLLADKKGARATIGIERQEGASDRQFRIKRVLAEDWVIREEAADAVLK